MVDSVPGSGNLWTMNCAKCDRAVKTGRYYIDGSRVCQTCRLHWRFENEPGFRDRHLAVQRESQKQKRRANPKEYRASQKRRRDANPEGYRLKNRLWRIKNPVKQMLTAARARAKAKGLAFEITESDVQWTGVCPVLNLLLRTDNKAQERDSASLDRIDNSRGYVPGNVRVISWRANDLKRNATAEELEAVAKDLRRQSLVGS